MTPTNHNALTVSWEMGPKLSAAGLLGRDGLIVTTEDGALYWNGWAVPAFTAEQMDAVIAACADADERLEWRGEGDARTLVFTCDDEDTTVVPQALADGTPVWTVDGWTWDTDA